MFKAILVFIALVCFASAGYGQSTPGTVRFPTNLDDADSLIRTTDAAQTSLSVTMTTGSSTITVTSTALFPATGTLVIGSEIIIYKSKTSTTFTTLTRGADGTTVAAHTSGVSVRSPILSFHKRTTDAALIATQTKIGSGASTPTINTVLKGTGTGASAWVALASLPFLNGTGTANAYALWADSDSLQNGYLKQETDAITVDGTAGSAELRLMTNGLAGATDRTLGVLYADANVVELTARRNGTFSSQVTAIRLNALGTTGLVQVAKDGTVKWTFDGVSLMPSSAGTHTLGNFALPLAGLELAFAGTGVTFWNSSAQQLSLQGNIVNTLSMFDSDGLQLARFNYGPSIYLQAVAGSPEGVVTAGIGSLVSRTNGSTGTSLYIKESGTGNTGWVAVAGGGGGTTINATDGVMPYRANSTTFANSPITASVPGSMVNGFTVTGAATTAKPIFQSTGSDATISPIISAKGASAKIYFSYDGAALDNYWDPGSGLIRTYDLQLAYGGGNAFIGAEGIRLTNASFVKWFSSSDGSGSLDTGLIRQSASVVEINNGTAGQSGALLLRGRTFANAPATPVTGMMFTCTDSSTATYGATVTGGGANIVIAWYNGTNWIVK